MADRLLGWTDNLAMIPVSAFRRNSLWRPRISPEQGRKMRANHIVGLFVFAAILGATPAVANSGTSYTPEAVTQLIARLGSTRFKERERAAAELNAIGEPALAALKKAAQDRDPEVRRRAETLANSINRRVETAQLLEPKRVHLSIRDKPLTEAIAELASQADFTIELIDSPAHSFASVTGIHVKYVTELQEPTLKSLDPRVTLEVSETSFWEAFDLFCRKVGLVEKTNMVVGQPGSTVWNVQAAAGQRIMAPIPGVPSVGVDGKLLLEAGDPPASSTCYAGSVRVRAKTPSAAIQNSQVRKGEALVSLEVTPQPKMVWQGIVDCRVEKIVDDRGRPVSPLSADLFDSDAFGLLGNSGLLWETNGQVLPMDGRSLPIRVKTGNRRIKSLKDLEGVVSARVMTPPQSLIAVDNVMQAGGRSLQGPNGESLTVMDAARTPAGEIKIKLRLEDSRNGWMAMNRRGNVIVRRNNQIVMRGGITNESLLPADSGFFLYDSQGKAIRQKGRGVELMALGNGVTQEMTLIYEPDNGQAKVAKLVYSGRRTVIVDIPFALKDVPLFRTVDSSPRDWEQRMFPEAVTRPAIKRLP